MYFAIHVISLSYAFDKEQIIVYHKIFLLNLVLRSVNIELCNLGDNVHYDSYGIYALMIVLELQEAHAKTLSCYNICRYCYVT